MLERVDYLECHPSTCCWWSSLSEDPCHNFSTLSKQSCSWVRELFLCWGIVVTHTYFICWESRHSYAPITCTQHLFWVILQYHSQLTLVKLIKLKRTQTVCTGKEREWERKKEKTERKNLFLSVFFSLGKNELPHKFCTLQTGFDLCPWWWIW